MLSGLLRWGFRLAWTLAARLALERNAQLLWPWGPPVPCGVRLPVQRWRFDVARTVLPCRYGCSCLAARPVWSRHAPGFLLAPLRGCGSWRDGIAWKLLCGAVRRIRLRRCAIRLRWRMVRVALLAARRFTGQAWRTRTRTVPASCSGQRAALMAVLVRSGRATRSPGAWRQSRLPGCGASHRHDPGASHTLNGKIMMVLAGARLPALLAAGGHSWFLSGMIAGKISY